MDHSPVRDVIASGCRQRFFAGGSPRSNLPIESPLLVALSAECFAKDNCAPDSDFVARNDVADKSVTLCFQVLYFEIITDLF